MTHYTQEHVIYEFATGQKPIATITPGVSFSVACNDCFLQQVQTESDLVSNIDFSHVNPATGPFYIEGAAIGDTLKVEIQEIEVHSKGSIVVLPDAGALGHLVREPKTRIVQIENGQVDFLGHRMPVNPMIGVIGVSPGADQPPVETGTPGNHGGNMDTTDIKAGSTLYLPVRETGAMLALGDCHAIMGDGELCVSGLEVEATVTLRVSLIKNTTLQWPILENNDEVMVIASAPTLDEAVVVAGTEMTQRLTSALDISFEDAFMFNSLYVDYKISQVVNPMKTVRAVVSKSLVSMEQFLTYKYL